MTTRPFDVLTYILSSFGSGATEMRGVLQGYDNRYARLVDWVSETEGIWNGCTTMDPSSMLGRNSVPSVGTTRGRRPSTPVTSPAPGR